jgi:hypothetical protein
MEKRAGSGKSAAGKAGFPFSASREKVPEADEGAFERVNRLALTPALSRKRERGKSARGKGKSASGEGKSASEKRKKEKARVSTR